MERLLLDRCQIETNTSLVEELDEFPVGTLDALIDDSSEGLSCRVALGGKAS